MQCPPVLNPSKESKEYSTGEIISPIIMNIAILLLATLTFSIEIVSGNGEWPMDLSHMSKLP